MSDPNHLHLLARPGAAGRRAAALTFAVDAAQALGCRVTVLTAPTPAAIPALIDEHRDEMHRLVIVGGDGLIHHALPSLVDSSIIVGIVPSGTGNDFARGLGIGTGPKRPAARQRSALRQAILGSPRPIDLIQSSDGRVAASVVTAGFSGRVTARANTMRFPPGQSKYTVATLFEAARLEPVSVRFGIDGGSIEVATAFFAIGNTRYFGGGMAICPDAVEDDGLLDLVIVEAVPALQLLRVMPTVFTGRHVRHPKVTTHRAKTIELSSDEPLWADGEPFGRAPIELSAHSRALLVAQPVR